MPPRSYDWIAHHARRAPRQLAAVDLHTGRRLDYVTFHERVAGLAGHLRGLGVERGDRVAMLAANSTDCFEIEFACARLGALFLPLNWRLARPELEFIVGDATPSVLIHDAEFAAAAAAIAPAAGIRHLIDRAGEYEGAVVGGPAIDEGPPLDHDDVWTVMYTSGTTGRPKGALITFGMTFWNAINIGIPARVGPDTVSLVVLPTFHTGGLNLYANPALHAGGTMVVPQAFDAGEVLTLLSDPALGITHFFGVPTMYLFMAQHPDFETADFSHLTTLGVGGAAPSITLLETYAARGGRLQQGYGMTETSPTVTVLDVDRALDKTGSAGQKVLHCEVRVVGEDGTDAPAGDVGELWVRGPNVTPGYWNRPEATAEAITDGWLHTGDAVRVDDEGFYYVVDRWKDMYISGGENVYPAEVENALYELAGVVEVAVFGVPDERWGEVGCAAIVPAAGVALSEEDVFAHCQGRLARFKVPRRVVFVDELPHNATGKVLKRQLRDDLAPPPSRFRA